MRVSTAHSTLESARGQARKNKLAEVRQKTQTLNKTFYYYCLLHHPLIRERVSVESRYPIDGTRAFSQELLAPLPRNHSPATPYVPTAIIRRLVQLTSQALSNSTRLFLSSLTRTRCSSSCSICTDRYAASVSLGFSICSGSMPAASPDIFITSLSTFRSSSYASLYEFTVVLKFLPTFFM